MPLMPGRLSAYNFRYDNWGTNPSATPGTSVTPGASNGEGSWTQIASSANIAQDCYWPHIKVSGGGTATAAKPQLLDIGVDPAGGTSYVAIVSNIACGASSAYTAAGSAEFVFPLLIRAGSAVAVRVQGANATAGTVRVTARFYGQPDNPEAVPVGSFSETIGTITNSNGVSFTPGNAADGSWVSLGTTARELWWWQLGYQVDNATITAEYCYVELAFGDASNKHTLLKIMNVGTTSETVGAGMHPDIGFAECYHRVPAGSTIYVRGRCNNAPDTGYNAVAIGVGG